MKLTRNRRVSSQRLMRRSQNCAGGPKSPGITHRTWRLARIGELAGANTKSSNTMPPTRHTLNSDACQLWRSQREKSHGSYRSPERLMSPGRLTNVAADKHFSDAASPQWL